MRLTVVANASLNARPTRSRVVSDCFTASACAVSRPCVTPAMTASRPCAVAMAGAVIARSCSPRAAGTCGLAATACTAATFPVFTASVTAVRRPLKPSWMACPALCLAAAASKATLGLPSPPPCGALLPSVSSCARRAGGASARTGSS